MAYVVKKQIVPFHDHRLCLRRQTPPLFDNAIFGAIKGGKLNRTTTSNCFDKSYECVDIEGIWRAFSA